MMRTFSLWSCFVLVVTYISIVSCAHERYNSSSPPLNQQNELSYLALGDSYTIGESVTSEKSFPALLQQAILAKNKNVEVSLKIVAKTGWTTSDLLTALEDVPLNKKYDVVTLLIGVNNQYQGKPFDLYEKEFVQLLLNAVAYADNNFQRVIVLSIPDYAYTPFGQKRPNPDKISIEIDKYNAYAREICLSNKVTFIDITDITRKGLEDPNLVASDQLHPSGEAYRLFVDRLMSLQIFN